MIILEIAGGIILGLYGLYLAIGLALLLPEILWAIGILMIAPLKRKGEIPPEHVIYIAPLPELLKEIPLLFKEWITDAIEWITMPFLVLHDLATVIIATDNRNI